MIELIYFILMFVFILMIWGAFFAPRESPSSKVVEDGKPLLIFPKGTVVKMGGIPCELLQDTPFYSEHYLAMMKDESEACHEGEARDTL